MERANQDAVRAALLDVVHETLHPVHTGVWLRKSTN